ncbi:hypothetical protein [Opitutus terrae]|uniref:Uncharacterized protein n=1 Tax=Opitutus terrae (strain DSM 11246 / JCM 15787 / PB90-1) TaxID=452637 RepID=B1ZMC2_OPITP|nr:hypothetical protein [Opitutus terrae]ACB73375.1 hypothetical protein Oter_0084 [Opitutus terrae PB90-1]
MNRLVRASLLSLTVALVAPAGFAETSPLAADRPEPAPTTPAPKPKRDRAISDNLASTLAASMPKFNPPPKPRPEDEEVDLREVDKPRNGIIRLPKYTVRERRPPVFRERDIYTQGGFAELAKRRYLTPTYRLLNSIYVPFLTASPEQHALMMYAEQERLDNMAELNDTAQSIGRVDADAGAYIKRETDQTYMRTRDVGYQRRFE